MNSTPLLTRTAVHGPGDRRVRAGGPPVAALLSGLPLVGARVLVAGPHDDATIHALTDAGASVTWLTRSTRDAAASASRNPTVSMVVGGLDALPAPDDADDAAPASVPEPLRGRFDLVVAADGLGRLQSSESPTTTWRDSFRRLCGAVADGGGILLYQSNPVGLQLLDRLDRSPIARGHDGAGPPESLAELLIATTDAGLRPSRSWSAFGVEPATLLVERRPASVDSDDLAALMSEAVRDDERPSLLGDASALFGVAIRTGRVPDVATGWFTHAHREGTAPVGPPILVSDRAAPGHRLSYRVDDDGATVLECGGGVGDIVRDPDGLASVVGGPSVESLLLAACADADRPTIRRLLGAVVTWLRAGAANEVVTGAAALATLDGIALRDGTPVLRQPTWRLTTPTPVDVVIARCLHRFAATLIGGAHPHPWTATSDAVALTAMLAGAAGARVESAALSAAIDLEVRFRALERNLPGEEVEALRDRLNRLAATDPPVSENGYRQLWMAWRATRRELDRLTERSEWEAQILASRDLAIAKLDEELALYRATFFGRLLRLLRLIAGAARADARKVFRKARGLRRSRDDD
ncbi:hypothetical protein [Stackebrandtia soli]|uniref:hypothetical protein n=1 Tax=Stackebrandtia soli TaxID=1892856 RepID=UPI0039EAC4EF